MDFILMTGVAHGAYWSVDTTMATFNVLMNHDVCFLAGSTTVGS